MSTMTKIQSAAYWRLWSAACKAQGWTKANGMDSAAVDAKRKECLAECGFESSRDIDSGAGFSRWKSLCERLAGNLSGAVAEVRQNTPADRRRWVIRNELLPCLAIYAPPGAQDPAEYATNYLATILRDSMPWRTAGYGTGVPCTIDELDEQGLNKIMATLNARIGAKRRAAGHTQHDMLTLAGCRCRCAACKAVAKVPETAPF